MDDGTGRTPARIGRLAASASPRWNSNGREWYRFPMKATRRARAERRQASARLTASFDSSPACMSSAGALAESARLEEEPGASLGFVDPDLEEACGGDITVLVAHAVRLAHPRGEPQVVLPQLGKHVERRDVVRVVVGHALQPRNMADRTQRRSANLPDTLG